MRTNSFDEPRHQNPATSLPYDPEEWERRLAAARAQREKVLQGRPDTQQGTATDATAADVDGPSLTKHTPTAKEVHWRTIDRPVNGGRNLLAGSDRNAPAVGPEAPTAPPRFMAQVRPALLGLVVGAVAGTALAGFGGVGGGIGSLQSRLMPLLPFTTPLSPDLDVAPVLAATPPRVPAIPPSVGNAPHPHPGVTPDADAVSFAPLAVPPIPVASSPAVPAALLVTEPAPSVPALPKSRDLLSRSPESATQSAFFEPDRAYADGLPPWVPPRLMAPETILKPAPAVSTAPPPRRRAVDVVVHAPDRIEPDRRQSVLLRLTESDWPAERAVSSPYTISETHVRYYHLEDRAAAEELAEVFDAAARDFTSYSPSPDEGLLELWLAGQGTPRQAKPVRARAVAERATTSSPNLFTRIVSAVEGNTAGGDVRDHREDSWRRSFASQRSGAASPSRSATADSGRASSGGGEHQTSVDTSANNLGSSRGAGNDRGSGSGSGSYNRASSGTSRSDAGRGNDGGRGNGGDRGNGGSRGGSSADNNSGGKGNGADNGRGGGNAGGRGGSSDRGGNGNGNGNAGGGGKSGRGR